MANEQAKKTDSPAQARPGDPCTMVIFGAAGDLTKRKLIPALYNLLHSKLLPDKFAIVGVSMQEYGDQDFRDLLSGEVKQYAGDRIDTKLWNSFVSKIYYHRGNFTDPGLYSSLKDSLAKVQKEQDTSGNCLFYLAVAPQFFGEIVRQLGAAGLAAEGAAGWRRVIIEKPFGRDLDSAQALNKEIKSVLREDQIYRIDHYLGKETVQNMMVFRFGNGIFEPIWNRRYIDSVQITAAETVGVEERGGYYDTAGALRDMVPNHMMQLIAMTGMEPPTSFDSEAVRDEKAKLLNAIQILTPENVLTMAVRGQYGAGTVEDKPAAAYRKEDQVAPESHTETFAALELHIDNWRWAGVPFYIRTGKRLAERVTEIAINFKRAPMLLFRETGVEEMSANVLVMHIQPDEGISLRFSAKIPGPTVKLGSVDMNFKYSQYFGTAPSTGYETLLLDCMIGDPTLFQRDDMVEAGWRIVTPVLDVWSALPPRDFPNYPAGSWGPKEADHLLEREGRHWRVIG
ncbi:MAG TPA: glucose-6-phosphate dehydrogenase [Candidatus Binataceae bacterium]|nr:glucose-6-phosphate dehydrogenase [Candidatus Binataceae bacterium]